MSPTARPDIVVPDLFVSVIVPHYNDLAALRHCHAKLMLQSWPRDRFEIVIADNMSACGLDAVRDAAPSAIVVAAHMRGAGPETRPSPPVMVRSWRFWIVTACRRPTGSRAAWPPWISMISSAAR
jgi:hypothetical protein